MWTQPSAHLCASRMHAACLSFPNIHLICMKHTLIYAGVEAVSQEKESVQPAIRIRGKSRPRSEESHEWKGGIHFADRVTVNKTVTAEWFVFIDLLKL